uniref:DNA (cytosine-5-)-methyltransferase n=1 Tax=Chlamydomonas reinhardtii TaxID=3055 RepID=Q8S921_CHLRE|nr:chloroplast-resident DNA methyltransferase [Chlamydomonas reinhardtii]
MLGTRSLMPRRQPLRSGSSMCNLQARSLLAGTRRAAYAAVLRASSQQVTRRRRNTQVPDLAEELALLAPRRAPEDIDMVTASLAAAKGPLVAVVRPVNQGDGQSEAPAAINAVEPTPGVKGRRSRRNPFQALLATLQPGVATAQVSAVWLSSLRAQLRASSTSTQVRQGHGSESAAKLTSTPTAGQDASSQQGWKLHGVSARLPLAAPDGDNTGGPTADPLGTLPLRTRTTYQSAVGPELVGTGQGKRQWLRPGDIIRVTLQQESGSKQQAGNEEEQAAASGSSSSPAATTRHRYFLVQALYRDKQYGVKYGEPMVQLRLLLHGRDTVLEDAAADHELFLLDTSTVAPEEHGLPGSDNIRSSGSGGLLEPRRQSEDKRSSDEARRAAWLSPEETLLSLPLRDLDAAEVVKAKDLSGRPCGHAHSIENAKADLKLQRSNVRAVAAGLPPTYVYRHVYCPRQGLFRALRRDQLRLGQWIDPQQLQRQEAQQLMSRAGGGEVPPRLHCKTFADAAAPLPEGRGFTLAGVTYQAGEFMYVDAEKAGGQQGGPWAVVQLVGVEQPEEEQAPARGASGAGAAGGKGCKHVPQLQLKVRRFLRPEDLCPDLAYTADWWDLYEPAPASPSSAAATATAGGMSLLQVPVSAVAGKCAVVWAGAGADLQAAVAAGPALPGVRALDTFRVVGTGLPPGQEEEAEWAAASASPLGHPPTTGASSAPSPAPGAAAGPTIRPLATLDIFAGCGGLSEGLHQSGVSSTLWAVEFDANAAKAYTENNPHTEVLVGDCNTLLQEAMARAGQSKYCVVVRGREAEEGTGKADPAAAASCTSAAEPSPPAAPRLPLPGEVELLVGGPPCQGFSGLNRHAGSEKAVRNNSLVGSYLSYCDFYRPRYFILENVMGFTFYKPVQPTEGSHKSRQRRRRSKSSAPDCRRSSASSAEEGGNSSSAAEENNQKDENVSQSASHAATTTTITTTTTGSSRSATDAPGPSVSYFKLALRTLLDMGYQVRFGALNAGNYGVPQSRKRVFIIAALPEEVLPNWPRPMHSFRVAAEAGSNREGQQDQPFIEVPGGKYYANGAGMRLAGTPLRAVTVRDAIGNLPPITPGTKDDPAVPLPRPMSAFQWRLAEAATAGRQRSADGSEHADGGVGGGAPPPVLADHVTPRVLSEFHAKAASLVPPGMDIFLVADKLKGPGDMTAAAAQQLSAATGQTPEQYLERWQVVEPNLPENRRSGMYGRLCHTSYFRTATTKVGVDGWSLHPDLDQQRTVSVREVARSQGFPDQHRFKGSVADCYKQVGNAVPPPLALALGLQLSQALALRQQGHQQAEGKEEERQQLEEEKGEEEGVQEACG